MTLPKTGGAEWAASQASPWVPVNETTRRLDAAVNRWVVVDRDLAAPPGTCADGANYLVAGSPTGAWVGQAGKLATAVGTNAANGWLFTTVAVDRYRLGVQDENVELEYQDGSWVELASPSQAQRLFSFHFIAGPASSEKFMPFTPPIGETITFDDDFAGAVGLKISGGANPTADFTIDAKKNGTTVGSIVIDDTTGAVTWSTIGGAVSLIGGTDIFHFEAQATPDATLAGYTFTIPGTIS